MSPPHAVSEQESERSLRANADHDLLVRIDERTKNWQEALKTFVTKDEHQALHAIMKGTVSKNEFDPVKKLVYGFVGLTLITVIGAIVAQVIRK